LTPFSSPCLECDRILQHTVNFPQMNANFVWSLVLTSISVKGF
jgi:hypothetical protein